MRRTAGLVTDHAKAARPAGGEGLQALAGAGRVHGASPGAVALRVRELLELGAGVGRGRADPLQVGVDLGEVGEQAGLALVVQAQLGWVDRVAALVGATPAQLQACSRTRRISDSTTSRGAIRCPPETGWGWVWLGSVGSAWRRAQSSRWMTAFTRCASAARIPGGLG